jgi:Uma2 family endonuclease
MTWSEVCDDVHLRDLPFKIELNRWGKIVMSPARRVHGLLQMEIGSRLREMLPGGRVFAEAPVQTSDNVKVADVAWASEELHRSQGDEGTFTIAPEICVEILSPTNTLREMLDKQQLYFEAGAREFWLCDEQGKMRFLAPGGELTVSLLCPQFPAHIDAL